MSAGKLSFDRPSKYQFISIFKITNKSAEKHKENNEKPYEKLDNY